MTPILCRHCHNAALFLVGAKPSPLNFITGEGLRENAPESFVSYSAPVICGECDKAGEAVVETYRTIISPSLRIACRHREYCFHGIVLSSHGYRLEKSSHAQPPLYYVPGMKGATQEPTPDNVSESVVEWILTVLRDTGLPLYNNQQSSPSPWALRVEGLSCPELSMLADACEVEGIGWNLPASR